MGDFYAKGTLLTLRSVTYVLQPSDHYCGISDSADWVYKTFFRQARQQPARTRARFSFAVCYANAVTAALHCFVCANPVMALRLLCWHFFFTCPIGTCAHAVLAPLLLCCTVARNRSGPSGCACWSTCAWPGRARRLLGFWATMAGHHSPA